MSGHHYVTREEFNAAMESVRNISDLRLGYFQEQYTRMDAKLESVINLLSTYNLDGVRRMDKLEAAITALASKVDDLAQDVETLEGKVQTIIHEPSKEKASDFQKAKERTWQILLIVFAAIFGYWLRGGK